MGGRVGSITTEIIEDGLVFNMDAANRASYIPDATTTFNTIDLSQSGTLENGVAFIQPPISSSCWDFDGSDDYIDCGANTLILGNVPCTIASWLNVDSHSQYGLALMVGNGVVKGSFWLGASNTSKVAGGLYGYNIISDVDSGTGWHYVALTYDTTIMRLYIDGVQNSTRAESSANIAGSGIRLARANIGTQYWYNGNIANIQIYNRALSSTEVLHNYNALKGRFGL